jgi:hypothetical protein
LAVQKGAESKIRNTKWFDQAFEDLRVLSNVEGLMTLSPSTVSPGPNSQVEGQYKKSDVQNLKQIRGEALVRPEADYRRRVDDP